jgi:predicted aspartyl protease
MSALGHKDISQCNRHVRFTLIADIRQRPVHVRLGPKAMTLALKHTIVAILLILSLAAHVAAGPSEDALVAYNRGDYAAALRLFQQSADQGSATAQFNVGTMYANGQGVTQNYVEAVKWYDLAANQGLAAAQHNLALMYADGQGVPRNYVLAYKWFSSSAAQGYTEAAKGRDFITGRMTPAEVDEARKLVPAPAKPAPAKAEIVISMRPVGGIHVVPVRINDAITLNFAVDSGAADVNIPANIVSRLVEAGTLDDADFIGQKTYRLADGSTTVQKTFRIRSLKVGDAEVENVTGSVAPEQGFPLLGQSFLRHFRSWSIDNATHELLLSE